MDVDEAVARRTVVLKLSVPGESARHAASGEEAEST